MATANPRETLTVHGRCLLLALPSQAWPQIPQEFQLPFRVTLLSQREAIVVATHPPAFNSRLFNLRKGNKNELRPQSTI